MVCHLELFQSEQRILEMVRDGLENGAPCQLVLPVDRAKGVRVPRGVASVAKRTNRIRIISANGDDLPDNTAMELSDSKLPGEAPWSIPLPRWNTSEVLSFLKEDELETGGSRNILVVVQAPDRAGDFLRLVSGVASVPTADSLSRPKELKVSKNPIELIEGSFPGNRASAFPLLGGDHPRRYGSLSRAANILRTFRLRGTIGPVGIGC